MSCFDPAHDLSYILVQYVVHAFGMVREGSGCIVCHFGPYVSSYRVSEECYETPQDS